LGVSGDLRNAVTDRRYHGINVMLLTLAMDEGGHEDPRWATYRQARQLGGHVRKGEEGTLVVFWKPIAIQGKDAEPEHEPKSVPVLRHYTVFNVAQCEGLDLPPLRIDLVPEIERDARCEAFLEATAAEIRHGGSVACYKRRPLDHIRLPQPKAFDDLGAYYATAFHELIHWTGDDSRSPRTFGKRFGDEDYAQEELVAEFGSAFLCQQLQVDGTLRHPEYIGSWTTALKEDKRAIFSAASMARKVCEFLAGLTGVESHHPPSP
jgi:antirestriction protein ArdC